MNPLFIDPGAAALASAFALDVVQRSWPSAMHPVAWIGRGAALLAAKLQDPKRPPSHQIVAGTVQVVLVTTAAVLAVAVARVLAGRVSLQFAVDVFVLAASATLSGLLRAARRVQSALRNGDLEKAREGLRSLCSRDPSELDSEELAAGAVESVAENTSDSWVAPLFWYAVLGWPGAVAYRSVNTLDAMYGYRDHREWFGKAAARLDDLLNFVPARITAFLLWTVGPAGRRRSAWHIFLRDRGHTASPNAGQPMAMMAGLLGVRLTKRGCYALGDPERSCDDERLSEAIRIARRAGVAFAGTVLALEVWS